MKKAGCGHLTLHPFEITPPPKDLAPRGTELRLGLSVTVASEKAGSRPSDNHRSVENGLSDELLLY